jgi:hypothetical protein
MSRQAEDPLQALTLRSPAILRVVFPTPTVKSSGTTYSRARVALISPEQGSAEHDRSTPVQQHAILRVPLHSSCERQALGVAAQLPNRYP